MTASVAMSEATSTSSPEVSFLLRAPPACRTFADSWRRLAERRDPFARPEWFALTAKLLGLCEPFVVGVRKGEELLAALPLCRRGNRLSGLTSAHTPRYDLVGEERLLPALWSEIIALPGWDSLCLELVPAESPLARTLPALAERERCWVTLKPGPSSPFFALERFEPRLPAKLRANLRRRRKRLEEAHGPVTFERLATADVQTLESGFALEAAGWKGQARTAIACDPDVQRFYGGLARVFALRGQLSLSFLRVGGRRIAFHFALEDGRTYYLLKPGFDPAYGAFGPGQLLLHEAAADAERRGLGEFDFLGWDMEWKRPWAMGVRPHVTVSVHRPSLRGRVRHTAQDVLRPSAAKALATWRAALSRTQKVDHEPPHAKG